MNILKNIASALVALGIGLHDNWAGTNKHIQSSVVS